MPSLRSQKKALWTFYQFIAFRQNLSTLGRFKKRLSDKISAELPEKHALSLEDAIHLQMQMFRQDFTRNVVGFLFSFYAYELVANQRAQC